MVTNHRYEAGSDRFLAAIMMSFALKISAKTVTNAPAMQGCSSRQPVASVLPAAQPR